MVLLKNRRGLGTVGRRRSIRALGGFGGIKYLLDYSLADTMTRATEAAFVDPRPVANGGTGAFAWDFVQNTTEAEALAYAPTSLIDLPWIATAGITLTTGIADPAGGTDAVNISEASAGSAVYAESTIQAGSYTSGNDFWVTGWVKKDVGSTAFCGFYVYSNRTSYRGQFSVDQRTGAIGVLTTFTTVHVREHSGWYFFAARHPGYAATDMPEVRCYCALGTTWPTAAGSAVGDVDVFDVRVVDATALGELLANPTPWAGPGVMRTFTDGAILIEGARENMLPDSGVDGSAWTSANSPVIVSNLASPDGGVTAASLQDAQAGAYSVRSDALTTVSSTVYTVRLFVKKDADVSRFPGMQVIEGGTTTWSWMLNTSTGAISDCGDTAWDSLTTTQVDADWWLVEGVYTAGAVNPVYYVYPALGSVLGTLSAAAQGTAIFWGASVEVGAFGSSPIRTSGAAATRNQDVVSFSAGLVPARMKTGKWSISVFLPESSATMCPGTEAYFVIGWGAVSAAGGIQLIGIGGGTVRARFSRDAGTVSDDITVTWAAGATLTFTVDVAAGTWSISGFATGNASDQSLATPGDIAAGEVTIGARTLTKILPLHGVVYRPVAV